jgi:hypothetical protein
MAELKNDLRFSFAISQYTSGNISTAFLAFDDLQNTANSIEQGYYLNKLGILALDQFAPRLALDFFKRAAELKNTEAVFNQFISYLELAEWENAKTLLNTYPELFSNIPPELTDIMEGIEGQNKMFYYYRWQDYSLEELKMLIPGISRDEILQLWPKIVSYFEAKNEPGNIIAYLEIFRPYLTDAQIDSFSRKMSPESSITLSMAQLNYFDEQKIFTFLSDSTEESEKKYELLVKAIEVNPYATGLLKAYCLSAVDMGLSDYAEYSLMELYDLLPKDEYLTFEREFDEYKKSKQENSWSF